ncbi:hypothetical protein [Nocardia lijiangensis]|uniref:hypothetical protein n=1 Tax=Nocardia lijiangensis TaxID=299618 RepID=UPI003D732540
MKRGFVTECHTLIYCDTCGDALTDGDGEPVCFTSVHQAVAYVLAAVSLGWDYNGDTLTCDGCQATATCERDGHRFPTRQTSLLPGRTTRNTCTVCGIREDEI